MSRRRCCCGCEIAVDEFTRPDADNLGSQWDEISGDWEIFSNTAIETSGAGRAVLDVRHPLPDESMVVYLDTVDEEPGDIYEILINWKDANNYHLAQFEVVDADIGYRTFRLRLYRVSGGTPSLLIETGSESVIYELTGTSRTFIAIIGRGGFCAQVTGSGVLITWELTTFIAEGYYSGMGTDGRADIQVDNFEFLEHLDTKDGCPYCYCKCEQKPIPKQLTATIVDATGRMLASDGCVITLNWEGSEAPFGAQWYGERDDGDCCQWQIVFQCALDFSLAQFGLAVLFACNTNPGYLTPVSGSTCDPIYMRFGPFQVSRTDLVCQCGDTDEDGLYTEDGEYYVEVTE